MVKRIWNTVWIKEYLDLLKKAEKSDGTIEKYSHDLNTFGDFIGEGNTFYKEDVIAYKEQLLQRYAVTTVNSMLTVLNGFFASMGWSELRVKLMKIQRRVFRDKKKDLTRDEYFRLLRIAESKGNRRLAMIMQTICGTGIRISELQYITVESIYTGQTEVNCKGKRRIILLPKKLKTALRRYAKEHRITSGSLFTTRTGQPLNRSNVWKDMKRLCERAGVDPHKVFPHNLRHLFAKTFYNLERDIAKLADVLGHSNIETTRLYIMESGSNHERLINRMELIL